MKTSSNAYNNLCKQLKKMGYSGSLDDPRDIKKFLSMNSDHASWAKAIMHWNELVSSCFVCDNSADRVRSFSTLDAGYVPVYKKTMR